MMINNVFILIKNYLKKAHIKNYINKLTYKLKIKYGKTRTEDHTRNHKTMQDADVRLWRNAFPRGNDIQETLAVHIAERERRDPASHGCDMSEVRQSPKRI